MTAFVTEYAGQLIGGISAGFFSAICTLSAWIFRQSSRIQALEHKMNEHKDVKEKLTQIELSLVRIETVLEVTKGAHVQSQLRK